MAKRKHPAAASTEVHTPYRWTHANAAARVAENIGVVNADDVGCLSFQQDDGSVWTAVATGTGAGKWLLAVPPATTSLPGTMSAADKTKLNGISTGADVTSAALTTAGTTTAAVAATANKLVLAPVSMGTITTGTTQPISFTDALFTGLVTGGTAVGSTGSLGVIASAFASSGAETGTGAGQGGLGSAASSTQPYNTTDFAGGRFHCDLFKSNSEPLVLSDVLSTAGVSFPASIATPVILYLTRRTDLGADLKWRGWFYFRNQATGNLTPVTPNISVATVTLRIPQVFLSKDVGTSALYTPIASLGSAEVVFGLATDFLATQPSASAGATGKVADAGHIHPDGTVVVTASTSSALPSYTTSGGPGAGYTLTATGNGALASTVTDGELLVTGDRLLVQHGATAIDNDVYVLTQGTGGTPWSMVRYTGLDTAAKISGSLVRVRRGRRRVNGLYIYSSRATITMGTTKLYRKRIDDGASSNERSHWRADFGQLAAVANLQLLAGTDGAIQILQASTGVLGTANSSATIGEILYTLGASATAAAGIQTAWTAAVTQPDGGDSFIASNEVGFRIAARVAIPTLSTAAQEFSVQFGLCKTRANQQRGSSDGTLWVYDRLTNVDWRAVTSLAGTTTGTDTDSGVAADSTYRELAIEKDPGDDSLYLLLDDVLMATHSTNLPNAQLLGMLCMAFKVAGSLTVTNAFKIDWIERDVWWPKGRA